MGLVAGSQAAAPRWQAALGGRAAASALERVRAIAARLERAPAAPAPELALRALFLAACDEAFPGAGHRRHAELLLERAVAMAAERPLLPRLFGGLLTVAWVVDALAPGEELTREVDDALGDELATWSADCDLVFGLAGAGVYALARGRCDLAAGALEKLAGAATRIASDRLAWHTPPAWMLAEQRAATPLGHYNAGVAHGAAGIAGFAARALARGVHRECAARLMNGAIAWLESIALDGDACFPCWLPGAAGYRALAPVTRAARSAWCYGDPGVAVQLWAAGRAAGRPHWQERAVQLARAVLARPAPAARIGGGGLCHGAAGVAHIMNRLAQASGDPVLARGAVACYARAAELAPEDPWFLTGAAGIGLALLAAAHDAPPAWDALLLLDEPR